MSENGKDNLQTWPRAQLPAKVRSELNEWIQNEKELSRAKAFLASQGDQSEYGALIRTICELIEQDKQSSLARAMMASGASIGMTVGGQTGEKRMTEGMMANGPSRKGQQQQMQSMILCKMPPRRDQQGTTSRRTSDAEMMRKKQQRPTPALLQGMQQLGEEEEEEGKKVGEKPNGMTSKECTLPWILQMLPNVSIVLSALLYLIAGATLFRLLDPEISKKPFHWALILSFEICATIGWGDSKPTNRWSQAFCTVYTLFGVPILFSAFANIGRLISHFYTVDWLFLTGVVRKKIHGNQHRLPIKRALNFLFLHQFVGALLYSGLVKDLPVVTAIYFSVTSMGTIGIGDYHPDAQNGVEAVLALVYIGGGIILLSALLLSINYYYQAIFFIWLRDKLHPIWEWSEMKAKKKMEQEKNCFGNGA